jgi:tryptophan synthase alpha chain
MNIDPASRPANPPGNVVTQAFPRERAALMPYFTLGYPDYSTSLDVVAACASAGADLLELGVPFSDPLADGPTIQQSSQQALENGITPARCLEAVSDLRARGVQTPFMLMTYYNPVLAFGEVRFAEAAAAAGANGLIVPDLPPEEAGELEAACLASDLVLTFLLAPNSPPERIEQVCARSTGFTYLVTVTGITGAREQLPTELAGFVERVRPYARTPLAVGFGISTPAQAAAVGRLADGVIVGSALIRAVGYAVQQGESAPEAAEAFTRSLLGGVQAG